ncbi:MAG: hypothetical protein ABI443_02425 [Chthoniobacterales bacterium]
MKVAYTVPAGDELYVVEKKAATRVVRALCPDVPLLAFQTMHGPKMSSDIPYLVTFSSSYIRVLSVRSDLMSESLRRQFHEHGLPYICEAVTRRRETSYSWPAVIIAVDGVAYEVTCSDGGLFPDADEIFHAIKKRPRSIFSYEDIVS